MNLVELYILNSPSHRYDVQFMKSKYLLGEAQCHMLSLVIEAMNDNKRVSIGSLFVRRSGKTYALMCFAKEYGIPVIVNSLTSVNEMKRVYQYENVHTVFDMYNLSKNYRFALTDELISKDNSSKSTYGMKLYGYE